MGVKTVTRVGPCASDTLTMSLGMQHVTGAHTDGKYFASQVDGWSVVAVAGVRVCAGAVNVCVCWCRVCVCVCAGAGAVCVCVCVLVPCVCVRVYAYSFMSSAVLQYMILMGGRGGGGGQHKLSLYTHIDRHRSHTDKQPK